MKPTPGNAEPQLGAKTSHAKLGLGVPSLPPGYKQTEVGVIPEEWEASAIGAVFNITAGGDVDPTRSQSYRDERHPHPIYSNALTNRGLYGYCSYADHPADSLTVTARGMVGAANFRDHAYTAIGRVLVLQPQNEIAGIYFSEVINNRVKFANESTGVPQLTAPQISKYLLPVPPLPEQRAIATALSDVDGLLGGLDRLIAKKRDLKQAAMQQLLTGQTRLPGFHGEWDISSLERIVTRATGVWGANQLDENHRRAVEVIRAGDISQDGKLTATAARFVSDAEFIKAKCELDDLVITTSGNGLGKVWWCDGRANVIASNFVRVLRPDKAKANGKFMSFVLRSTEGMKQLQEHTATSAYPNLRPTYFSSTWIPFPPLPEQTAIATVLSDMDLELAALEQRREKTRALKQGMMQELLTGRTRLL